MLHKLYTVDYGSRKSGSRPANVEDEYHPLFFLDYISIIGRPLKPLTRPTDRFFDNVTITFRNWRASYSGKHVHGLPFELEHRTFRLATAATREAWFIVMHPIHATATELPLSRRERQKREEKSFQLSALRTHHAQLLASYIKDVFLTGELLGEGVEPSWSLDGSISQTITSNKWTAFQRLFMEDWGNFAEQHSLDVFWTENQPAFHAYDYGANIEIEVNEQLQTLPKETRLRPVDDSESDGEGEYGEGEQDWDSESRLGLEADLGSAAGDDQQAPYTEGLNQLRTELEHKYELDHIHSISYALAVDIHCLDVSSPDPEYKSALCLLANRNAVASEYKRSRDFTFYPLAFHPVYGNFSSPHPPSFLSDNLLTVMKDNMSFQNQGADVLSFGHFQGYSNIKRSIRHRPDDLLADKGFTTAALTLSASDVNGARIKAKQQRLLRRVQGELSPGDPEASKPFARERQRIEAAIAEEEFAFRMEQVVSINVCRLVRERRRFDTVLRPIFQLTRFFLKEKQLYTHLLRCFQPSIFPKVLSSFARVFELAMGEMYRRFEASGGKGLGMALSEGVAALDRLGSYCFTGLAKVLMGSVLGPLGTTDSIQKGAWPYISPRMLDVRDGVGELNVGKWPRTKNGRPILMHIASLSYYYGPEVAVGRHSQLWFRELGGKSIRGPSSAARFLEEVFRDLWIPEMKAFVGHQLQRQLNQGRRGQQTDGVLSQDLETAQRRRVAQQDWLQAEHPFSRRYGILPSARVRMLMVL